MNKSKNVFISHYGKDDQHIGKLRVLLEKKGYTLRNSSVDSSKPNRAKNPEYIRRLLRLRIHWAGTFICLIGSKTATRDWVDWEIRQAAQKGKRIIGVFAHGAKNSDIPEALDELGDGLTGWNSDKIIDALEGKDIGWCTPEGNPRIPIRTLERIPRC